MYSAPPLILCHVQVALDTSKQHYCTSTIAHLRQIQKQRDPQGWNKENCCYLQCMDPTCSGFPMQRVQRGRGLQILRSHRLHWFAQSLISVMTRKSPKAKVFLSASFIAVMVEGSTFLLASASHRTSFEKRDMDHCERFCEKQISEVMFAKFLFSGNMTCEVIVRIPTARETFSKCFLQNQLWETGHGPMWKILWEANIWWCLLSSCFLVRLVKLLCAFLQQGRHSASASHRTSFEKQGMDQCERFCEKQMSEVMFAQFLFSGNRTCEVIVRVPTFLVSAVEFYTWTPGAESFVYRG